MIKNKKLKEVIPSSEDVQSIILRYCKDFTINLDSIRMLEEDLMKVLKATSEESWINGYTSALIDNKEKYDEFA